MSNFYNNINLPCIDEEIINDMNTEIVYEVAIRDKYSLRILRAVPNSWVEEKQ